MYTRLSSLLKSHRWPRVYIYTFFLFFFYRSPRCMYTRNAARTPPITIRVNTFLLVLCNDRARQPLWKSVFFLPKLPLHSVGSILYLTYTALYIHTKTIFIDMTCLHSVASWIDARIPYPGQISTLTNKKNLWHSAERIFLFLFVN